MITYIIDGYNVLHRLEPELLAAGELAAARRELEARLRSFLGSRGRGVRLVLIYDGDDVGQNQIKDHCRLEHAASWAGTVLISRTDGSDGVGTLEDGSPFNGTIRFRWDAKEFVYRSEGFQVTLTGAQEIRTLTGVDDGGSAIDSEIADIASLRIYVKPIVTTRASNANCFLCAERLTNDQCFTSDDGAALMPEFAVDLLDALPSGALRRYVLRGCPGVRIKVGGNYAIYGPAEVQFILRKSGARAFVCPKRWRNIDYVDRIERLDRSELDALEHVVVLDDAPPPGCLSWNQLEHEAPPRFVPPDVDADDVCLLIFTSGTTAEPKGVQHTHNTLLAELGRGNAMTRQGVHLSAFPAGHIAGVLGLARLYLHGGTSILMDAWDADAAARLIEAHGVTNTSGTPFHLTGLLDAADASGRDLSSLQGYLTGAASVPPPLVERAHAAGVPTYRSYGSSEHPTISSGLPTDPLERRAGTDGQLLDGCEVRILDEDGEDRGRDLEGEIVCRGPELFVGYTDDALNELSFLAGGWFQTGDVGVLDADGFLRITDRKKDIIIRGGENISSKEVEDILARHPAVVEAAAVGMPDERLGERVCAYVIVRAGTEFELTDAADHFTAEGVARQKTPERLIAVDELPRTSMGKVRKVELRRRLRER